MPPDSPRSPLLNEVWFATDYILRVSRSAALSLGRGMASTVVARRHLWLTLSDVPDQDRAVYLDEPVSAEGLFGQSLDAMQAKFELRKKQTEALSSIIPRRDAKPKQPASLHKPAPPPPKRTARPVSSGPQPVKQQAPGQNPRPSAWSKGLPPGPQRGSAPWRKKKQSS